MLFTVVVPPLTMLPTAAQNVRRYSYTVVVLLRYRDAVINSVTLFSADNIIVPVT